MEVASPNRRCPSWDSLPPGPLSHTIVAAMATFAAGLSTGKRGSTIYLGRWATKELAELARDRAALHLELDVPLRNPRRARRLGPASPEELRRLARRHAPSRSSKYWGVSYLARQRRFYAYVDHDGARLIVGIFRTEVEAAIAVDRVALRVGRTASNFPERKLTPASPEQIKQERHRRRKRATTSKYIGVVHIDSDGGRPWHFYLNGTGGHTAIGGFGNERDAAIAHDRAALRYCTRPLLNFPDEARALGPIDFATLRKQVRAERKKTTSSRYRGVCWNKRRHKWYAAIRAAGTNYYLGVFDDEADAAHAYDAAASRLLGDEAILNFSDDESQRQNAVSSARVQPRLRSTRAASRRTTRTP